MTSSNHPRARRLGRVPRQLVAAAVLALGLGQAATAGAQAVDRHPYLQRAGSDQITIVWTTDAPTDSVVRWGAAPDALEETTTVAGSRTQHEVRLTGLSPSTTYYYSVGTSATTLSGGDEAHQLTTAPPRAEPAKFRAWVVGDSGTGAFDQIAVRDAMLAHVGRWDLPHHYI